MPLTRLQHRRNLAEAGAKAQTKAKPTTSQVQLWLS